MTSNVIVSDHNYHAKQKDPKKSISEELQSIYLSAAPEIHKKTTEMVNSLSTKELYYELAEHKQKYEANISRFTDGINVDRGAVDRDPLLSKFQKTFEAQFLANAAKKNGGDFMKNSYSGYGSSAHFMIRAISYIYPMLIIKPLPTLTWREDFPVFAGSPWAAFDVFMSAERITDAMIVDEQSTDSGRAQASFGESVFKNITIRQDLVWDSTAEMYADQSMNNGLVNYVFMESLKRGFDQKISDLYLFGDDRLGMTGLVDNPSIPRILSGGSWDALNPATGEKWATTDLINLCSQIEQQSLGVYSAKKIMMSLKLKPKVIQPRSAYVSTSPIGYVSSQKDGSDFETLLSGARYNPYLNDRGTSSLTQMAVAYDYDTTCTHIGVPTFMFPEPISFESHKYKMPFITRTGGFRVLQTPSIAILDNIATT